ncbi:MAG: glycosyltransferase family 2 protein [Bacteroidota bacterium]
MPSITIIIATNNSAATLASTLTSVQNQLLAAREVLVQDRGSTDGTLAIARSYPNVITQSDAFPTPFEAINRGIGKADGDVIGILGPGDQFADESVLSDIVEMFANDPEIQAVYGDLEYTKPDQPKKVVRYWKAGESSPQLWRRGWMPPHPTFFVRRSVYYQYGTFNSSFRYAADYELMLRLCYKYQIKLAYLQRVIVRTRAGEPEKTSLRNRLLANQEDQRAWRINGMSTPRGLAVTKPLLKLGQWMS